MAARLENPQRDILWGGGALANKPHLLNWSIMCVEEAKGGFGFQKNLSTFNKAFLGKWF